MSDSPKLYNALADWWPLMSAPEEYVEEAGVYSAMLVESGASPVRSLLELGSGGGNNASHIKAHFDLTLVELSPGMLEVSKRLNPECEHHQGDMRTVRLGRQGSRKTNRRVPGTSALTSGASGAGAEIPEPRDRIALYP